MFNYATLNRNLENMKWLKNGCKWNEYTFSCAALVRDLKNIK